MARIDWKEKLKQTIDGTIVHGALPTGSTKVGGYMFTTCSSLQDVELPEGVKSIGAYAFNECQSLREVEIPQTCTSIGQDSFFHNRSLSSINIPSSVTTIGARAFSQGNEVNVGATTLVLNEGILTINSDAFARFRGTHITIPNSCTIWAGFVFCTNCIELDLGTGVRALGSMSLRGWTQSWNLTMRSPVLVTCSTNSYPWHQGSPPAHIYVPSSLVDEYKANSVWGQWASRISAIEDRV